MDGESINMILNISSGSDADADELDRLTRALRTEIQDIEVESVELVREQAKPERTKGVDPVTFGALAIAVLPSVAPKLIDFLQSWVMRADNRTVKIKTQIGERSLEVECSQKLLSQDELKKLIDTLTRESI
jgi:hypothetical protein